jgi:hypothetical protein
MTGKKATEDSLDFEIRISIFNNPLLWRQLLIVSFLSSGFVLFLLVGLNLYEGNWEQIPGSFLTWLVLAGGIFAAFALILMFLSRGIVTRYVISDEGIVQETLTGMRKLTRKVPFFALLFGGTRGMTAAGAGMLAKSREVIGMEWKDVSAVEMFPSRFEIRLKNKWRTVVQLMCLSENYQDIVEIVHQQVSESPPVESDSVFSQMICSLSTLLLGFFLFPILPVRVPGLFIILIMIFSFPAIWSHTRIRKISAVIILFLLISGISLAVYFGEVNFSRSGCMYAFAIEFLAWFFFMFIAVRALFTGKHTLTL